MQLSWLIVTLMGIVIGATLMEVSTVLGGTVLFLSGWSAGLGMADWK